MNDHTLDDETRFDRLVDGELSPSEYRELLASLDDEPDGWRRCATAFLEAQAWGQEFRSLKKESQEIATAKQPVSRGGGFVTMFLAVAASFVIAFGLGVYFRGWPNHPPNEPENLIVETDSSGDVQVARSSSSADEAGTIDRRPVGNVELLSDQGNDRFSVPFYEIDQMKPEWLADDLFAMPQDLVNELNRMGHEVRRDQRLIPVELEGGRRVVIPMDQFEIVPISQNHFQ